MTNLTEYSWYYCKMKDGDIEMLERGADYFLSGDVPLLNNEVESVLAEVPSYEEYQKLLSDQLAKNEGAEINAELEAENKELKEILERHKKATAKAQIRSCDLEIINAQLKSLLKECRDELEGEFGIGAANLVEEIDEVLK